MHAHMQPPMLNTVGIQRIIQKAIKTCHQDISRTYSFIEWRITNKHTEPNTSKPCHWEKYSPIDKTDTNKHYETNTNPYILIENFLQNTTLQTSPHIPWNAGKNPKHPIPTTSDRKIFEILEQTNSPLIISTDASYRQHQKKTTQHSIKKQRP
jgi:hypothetical protein